jgi:hypothetical protein
MEPISDKEEARLFIERSVMAEMCVLPGPMARRIARYISNLEQTIEARQHKDCVRCLEISPETEG